jgi:hypothetical protein
VVNLDVEGVLVSLEANEGARTLRLDDKLRGFVIVLEL